MVEFVRTIAANGVSSQELLWMAARISGGSNLRYHHSTVVHERVVGIACPETTILLDILRDPREIAKSGISKGLLSIPSGSIPILPRDPNSNMIIAADLSMNKPRQTLRVKGSRRRQNHEASKQNGLIFTTEPFKPDGESLSTVLCAWEQGDVALEIDIRRVLVNLLLKRGIERPFAGNHYRRIVGHVVGETPTSDLFPLNRRESLTLKQFEVDPKVIGVVQADTHDWQIIAAGSIQPGRVIMATEDGDGSFFKTNPDKLGPGGHLLVACRQDVLPQGYKDQLGRYFELAKDQGDDVGHLICYDDRTRSFKVKRGVGHATLVT